MALVIDASAMIVALLGRASAAGALRRRLRAEECHAPYLIDAGVGNVLRRHVLRGELAATDAFELLSSSWPLIDHRHEMTTAIARSAWRLRENVSFYNGLYVALAAGLALPLVTADSRLAKAPGIGCIVEQVKLV